jgi:hypothetical protein
VATSVSLGRYWVERCTIRDESRWGQDFGSLCTLKKLNLSGDEPLSAKFRPLFAPN